MSGETAGSMFAAANKYHWQLHRQEDKFLASRKSVVKLQSWLMKTTESDKLDSNAIQPNCVNACRKQQRPN